MSSSFLSFIADGKPSEFFDVVCVSFDATSGAEKVSGGIETELNTVKVPRGADFHIMSQEYSKPLSFTFQIANSDFSDMDEFKERAIKKWLCQRGKYIDFIICDKRFLGINFKANISNPQLIKVGRVVGMEFTVNCKSPFGYSNEIKVTLNTILPNQQFKLYLDNDEDDYIYPDMIITSNVNGDISISNNTDVENYIFTIRNLKIGEIITIKGNIPDISTSVSSHAIWTDFNKKWFRLTDCFNTITVSNLCDITLIYKEPRKVGV